MKGSRFKFFLVAALVVVGLVLLFFSYYDMSAKKQPVIKNAENMEKRPIEAENETAFQTTIQEDQKKNELISTEKVFEGQAMSVEDKCLKIENELREFFDYLNKRDYITEMEIKEDMLLVFKNIVHFLTLDPPIPAGEGLNYDIIIKNIYYFYRMLDLRDIKLIKLILSKEADTMEINLSLFYRWLISGDECEQQTIMPPSFEVLYKYAGYFTNTIGGRAYLFRRETRLRLLLTYYCFLIIYEADKKKVNSFGIDIAPFIKPLAEEIENCPLLYFRKEYAGNLMELQDYYSKKRSQR